MRRSSTHHLGLAGGATTPRARSSSISAARCDSGSHASSRISARRHRRGRDRTDRARTRRCRAGCALAPACSSSASIAADCAGSSSASQSPRRCSALIGSGDMRPVHEPRGQFAGCRRFRVVPGADEFMPTFCGTSCVCAASLSPAPARAGSASVATRPGMGIAQPELAAMQGRDRRWPGSSPGRNRAACGSPRAARIAPSRACGRPSGMPGP